MLAYFTLDPELPTHFSCHRRHVATLQGQPGAAARVRLPRRRL
jgi:hypothetical protein